MRHKFFVPNHFVMNKSIEDHRLLINIIVITLTFSQGIIALGVLLKDILLKITYASGILFLLMIAPLGYYAILFQPLHPLLQFFTCA